MIGGITLITTYKTNSNTIKTVKRMDNGFKSITHQGTVREAMPHGRATLR
jgi:hypothetical protein